MKTMKYTTAGALAAVLISTAAIAGLRQPAPVEVDLVDQVAFGDMITAADAKDDDVFIGCGTRNTETGFGLFSFGFCQAEDAEGDRAVCFTTNPELVQTIREINDDSFILYGWSDDGAGNLTCTRIGASTQSFYKDKHAKGNQKGNER